MAAALSSQSGRMFIEMRDKKSLAYSLAAFYSPGLDVGTFGFYVARPRRSGAKSGRTEKTIGPIDQATLEPSRVRSGQGPTDRRLDH